MSKIFEALRKTEGETARVVLSSFIEDTGEPEPPAAGSKVAPAGPLVPLEPAPAPRIPVEIRSLPLRLPDWVPLLPFDTRQQRAASEQYRTLRTKIIQHPRQPQMIVISSAGPGDGKTVSAVNLAGALSLKAGANVLLVDGDFRRSSLAPLLGLPETPGLSDILGGTSSLEQALIQVEQFPNLHILPAGQRCSNPVERLDSVTWVSLCARLRQLYKHIVVDSTPIAAVADYDLIQAMCDGVVVVVRPDHTDRTQCLQSLASVPKDKLIGIVLNCVEKWFLVRDRHYGNYYY